jgi:hypothetical protein
LNATVVGSMPEATSVKRTSFNPCFSSMGRVSRTTP